MNAARGAAATRLKWPVERATSSGAQANAAPASHDSKVAPSVTRRASDEGHPGREDDHDQIDDIERRHRPEGADERHGQQVEEDRVVVLREIDRPLGEREDALGGERIAPLDDGALLEDPLVPDVHAGVAAGVAGQVRGEIGQQRPGINRRNAHIAQHCREVGEPRAMSHWEGRATLAQRLPIDAENMRNMRRRQKKTGGSVKEPPVMRNNRAVVQARSPETVSPETLVRSPSARPRGRCGGRAAR